MISNSANELQTLLTSAQMDAQSGNLLAARVAFRRASEIAPACVAAWLGQASVATVLAERRSHLERALALDPDCAEARAGLAQVDALLAAGRLIMPAAQLSVAEPLPAALPTSLSAVVTQTPVLGKISIVALLVGALLCLLTMTALTMIGALIFTSVLGYFLAFIVGPLVGQLMQALSDDITRARRGRAMQIAVGAAVAVGGIAALVFGGTLLPAVGLPLTEEALTMAREMGAQTAAVALLFNPAMLVFVGSAVAATVYRLKK